MSGHLCDFSPAEPEARAGAERDRCDLAERSSQQNNDPNCGQRDAGAGTIGRECSRHAPDRLRDDRDGDQLEAMQKTFSHRPGESGCAHRKGEQDQRRRHREGEPGRKAAQKAVAAENAEAKADLAGGRARQKLAKRDQIGISGLVEPSAAFNELVAEIGEVRDRAAERR